MQRWTINIKVKFSESAAGLIFVQMFTASSAGYSASVEITSTEKRTLQKEPVQEIAVQEIAVQEKLAAPIPSMLAQRPPQRLLSMNTSRKHLF
ncbi:hypothetical protein CWS02_00465 [Enterobacter sp. EA-1]|nr:hypothetical protein CWS02_00465 [Enterobacter sp. EA-1]